MIHEPATKSSPIAGLPARSVAVRFFNDGEGLSSNPYAPGTTDHEAFKQEMNRLLDDELAAENH